ncbi:MAG TPA: TonB-dependent receptor, partial [Flavobacterium sp.]|nr:TonB-dependent receptor [Flavobacterium sp.]
RGKLYHNISYNIRAGYKSEDDKAMFSINPYEISFANKQGFQYGNSFRLLYDRVNTLSVFGELNFDFSDDVKFGLSGEYNNYSTEVYNNAYHLPQAKVQGNVLINFTKQWFADLNIAFIGQRFDYLGPQVVDGIVITEKEIGEYTDFNMTIGYRPTSQWTFFLKGNNIFNENYYRFNQYQVQGIQVLGGAMYKFDF